MVATRRRVKVDRLLFRNGVRLLYRIPLYLLVTAGGITFALPFWWMVRTSIMPAWQVFLFPPAWIPAEINLQPWSFPFSAGYGLNFGAWMWNSYYISVMNVVGNVFSASMVGFSFARLRFPLRDTLFAIVLATMILPEHVRLVPTYLLMVKLGWAASYKPLIVPAFFAPAFNVFLLRQFFMSIPKDMDDAALIDGCSPWGLFWRIHLPMSTPALGVVAIFTFTDVWNDFLYPLLYIRTTKAFTVSLGLRLFQNNFNLELQGLMAASVLSILTPIILFFIAQRYFVQGIVVTGVKG